MLYYENPYLKSVEVEVEERKGNKCLLSDTILYPGGGGQPPDEGIAICNVEEFSIKHIGSLWHEIDGICKCDKMKIILNWERRYLLMRSHTAEHTFFRFLENKGAKMGKIALGEVSSIIFQGDISMEDILDAEKRTRELIKEGRNVTTFWINKDEIRNYPDLRIKLERIKDEKIRVVKIEGHDLSACKGVHISNLSEIEDFAIVHFRMGKRKEVKFVIGEKARNYHYRVSQSLRKLLWQRNLDLDKIENYIENLENENEKMRKALRDASKDAKFNKEKCGEIELHYLFLPYAERKIIQRKALEIVNHNKAITIYGIGENNVVCIAYNPSYPWARNEYMKLLSMMNGRGGGKGNFVSGSVEDAKKFVEELKKIICEKALQLHGDENGYS